MHCPWPCTRLAEACDDEHGAPLILRLAREAVDAALVALVGIEPDALLQIDTAILDVDVRPEEVVLCMIAVKMSRLCRVPDHRDSWTDIAGYAALGGEIADNFFDAVDDMKDKE